MTSPEINIKKEATAGYCLVLTSGFVFPNSIFICMFTGKLMMNKFSFETRSMSLEAAVKSIDFLFLTTHYALRIMGLERKEKT
jgi:hypothetical protein